MSIDQQAATQFAQGYAAFSRVVAMVLEIGDVEDRLSKAREALTQAQQDEQTALAALDKAKADAQKVSDDAQKQAAAILADAKASAENTAEDARKKADKALNDAVAEAAKQKADLDQQISDARAKLESLTASSGQPAAAKA